MVIHSSLALSSTCIHTTCYDNQQHKHNLLTTHSDNMILKCNLGNTTIDFSFEMPLEARYEYHLQREIRLEMFGSMFPMPCLAYFN